MGRFDSYKETEQEIKIQAQKQQIEKMSMRIGQIEEQYKNKEKHMMEKIQGLLHTEEMARGLCQKILDKDRREIVLGTSHSWSSMSTDSLIEAASKSYRAYCEKRTKDMKKIGEYASDLREKYETVVEEKAELKRTIEEFEQNNEVSSERKQQIRNRINGGKASIGGTEVEVCTEPDEESEVETQAIQAKKKAKVVEISESSKKSTSGATDLDKELMDQVRLLVGNMTDSEKIILKLVGDGMSVAAEIKDVASAATNDGPAKMAKSTAHRILLELDQNGFIEHLENINFPGTKKCMLFRLSKKGKAAYRLITNSEPNESEMDHLVRVHATLEHGYGIRACCRLLEKSGRYISVNMFCERIKVPDGTQGYIPDLMCTRIDENNNKVYEYFEYERCKQNDAEYYTKFGKMSMITDEINVIVANPSEHEKMQRLLAAWANSKKSINGYARKIIRLTNYNKIRECIEEKKPFSDWWYMADYLTSFRPPLGYEGPLGEGS